MQIKINPNSSYKGGKLHGIECHSNGAFNLKVEQEGKNYIYLHNQKGETNDKKYLAETGILLSDGCYILQGEPAKNHFTNNEIVFNGVNPKGTLYTKEGYVIVSGFEEFKVFSNGYYMLTFKESKQLFKSNHSLVAQNFIDCEVFCNDAYALRMDSPLYQTGTWEIYSVYRKPVCEAKNVVKFLGNALFLTKEKDDTYTLYNTKKEVCASEIVDYKELADNQFSLKFSCGASALYNQSGKRVSAFVEGDVHFLPDGTFVTYDRRILKGHYRSDGILIKEFVYRYEVTKHYYLVAINSTTELYDKNQTKVDDCCFIIYNKEDFILLERKNSLILYNQEGKVFECECIL